MATKPKSYKKDGYTYTESSQGSNRYQNFGPAKPTVKAVRDDSRKDKAVVAAKKTTTSPTYRGGPEGDGKTVVSKATSSPKYRGGPEGDGKTPSRQSTGPVSRGPIKAITNAPARGVMSATKPTPPAVSRINRQGGMDTGNVKSKSLVGSIINRVTQPPKQLTPASKAMLAKTRDEITPVLTALTGAGIVKKFGKDMIKAFTKKPKVNTDSVGRPIEELLKRGRGTPRVKPATARPFPKGKGTYKGKRTPGTYTAN